MPVPETSILSAALRPKVGESQTRMLSSFVWNGPLISSKSANWISVQSSGRLLRSFSQFAAAQLGLGVLVGSYAAGSSVS